MRQFLAFGISAISLMSYGYSSGLQSLNSSSANSTTAASSTNRVSSLSVNQFISLSPAFLQSLSASEVKSISIAQLQALEKSQTSKVVNGQKQQLTSLFTPTQITSFTRDQLAALQNDTIASMASFLIQSQVQSIPVYKIPGYSSQTIATIYDKLTNDQIKTIACAAQGYLKSLGQSVTSSAAPVTVQPTKTAQNFSVSTLNAMSRAIENTPSAKSGILTQINTLSQADIQSMSVAQIDAFIPTLVPFINVTSFTQTQLNGLSNDKLTQIMNQLTPTQIQSLNPIKVASLSVVVIKSIFVNLTKSQIASLGSAS